MPRPQTPMPELLTSQEGVELSAYNINTDKMDSIPGLTPQQATDIQRLLCRYFEMGVSAGINTARESLKNL